MKGIILLEGSDCTGKTTIARELVDKYDAKYLHCSYRFKDAMFQYHLATILKAIKLSKNNLVVIDRNWLSECVYAHTFRNGTKWPEMGRQLDRLLRRFGALYVFCIGVDDKKYHERFLSTKSCREEMYEDVQKVNSLYKQIYFGSSLLDNSDYARVIGLNSGFCIRDDCEFFDIVYHGSFKESFCQFLVKRVRDKVALLDRFPYARDTEFRNLLGNLNWAKYLIISNGKSLNIRLHWYPWMDENEDTIFFSRCLSELGIVETHNCYIDIRGEKGEEIIKDILSKKNCPLIYIGEKSKLKSLPDGIVIDSPPLFSQSDKKEEFKSQLLGALK